MLNTQISLPQGKKILLRIRFSTWEFRTTQPAWFGKKRICQWLDEIKHDAAHIFLVGDMFDSWLEFKNVVPKGFVRFLGKLAELRDSGIMIEAFTGNHDLWMRGYFEEELNIPVHHEEIRRTINGKQFLIAHGDGLGPGDNGYKFLKSILRNPFCQWLYRRVHPDTGLGLASYFSRLGPKHEGELKNNLKGQTKNFWYNIATKFWPMNQSTFLFSVTGI